MAGSVGVRVGDPAPDFSLPSPNGETVSLHNFRGQSAVVLFFFPRANTLVCTAEACAFRDSFEAFHDEGAEVIGVSGDSLETLRGFAARHRLPFHLLSDADGALRTLYGVPKTFGLIPGRVTYVIDLRGIVRHIFVAQFQTTKHVEEAIRILKGFERT